MNPKFGENALPKYHPKIISITKRLDSAMEESLADGRLWSERAIPLPFECKRQIEKVQKLGETEFGTRLLYVELKSVENRLEELEEDDFLVT